MYLLSLSLACLDDVARTFGKFLLFLSTKCTFFPWVRLVWMMSIVHLVASYGFSITKCTLVPWVWLVQTMSLVHLVIAVLFRHICIASFVFVVCTPTPSYTFALFIAHMYAVRCSCLPVGVDVSCLPWLITATALPTPLATYSTIVTLVTQPFPCIITHVHLLLFLGTFHCVNML